MALSVMGLCRCGASTTKPFCDGTHSKVGFQAAEQAVKAKRSEGVSAADYSCRTSVTHVGEKPRRSLRA